MFRIIRLFTAALLLCAGSANAQIEIHPAYYVGSGAHCDFADIQSAINAAESNPPTEPSSYIYVAPEGSAYTEHLSITKSMSLIGTDQCGDGLPPPNSTPFAIISGAGGGDAPVIAIGGSSDVRILGLEITGGHAGSNGFGGGIDFSGNGGSLTLSNVVIDNNSSHEGGGLAITPVGTSVTDIFLNDYVQIFFNTATDSGAGVYVGGSSEVYVMGRGDFIAFNTAGVSGGGIFVREPAHVALGSPGLNGLLIYHNNAQYGGGIAAYAEGDTDGEDQLVSLFATDAESPGQISSNGASVAGGAVYLKGSQGIATTTIATFCAQDFRINDNYASDGAALKLDWDSDFGGDITGSNAYFNSIACRSAADLHAVHCAAGVACNEMSDNIAEDSNFQPSGGATVLVGEFSGFYGHTFSMRGNQGGYLFLTADHADTYPSDIRLGQFLANGNALTSEAIRLQGDYNGLGLNQVTFAEDIINSTHVIKFDNSTNFNTLILLNSIIDEPGTLTLNYPGSVNENSHIDAAWLLSNDIGTLPSGVNIVKGTPLFVDGDNADPKKRDYHLQAYVQNGHVTASPGIDFALPTGGTDLDGNPYDQDVPTVTNFGGVSDIGAYEAQPIADRIFGDALGDPLSLVFPSK